jgi:hypothetical protein
VNIPLSNDRVITVSQNERSHRAFYFIREYAQSAELAVIVSFDDAHARPNVEQRTRPRKTKAVHNSCNSKRDDPRADRPTPTRDAVVVGPPRVAVAAHPQAGARVAAVARADPRAARAARARLTAPPRRRRLTPRRRRLTPRRRRLTPRCRRLTPRRRRLTPRRRRLIRTTRRRPCRAAERGRTACGGSCGGTRGRDARRHTCAVAVDALCCAT